MSTHNSNTSIRELRQLWAPWARIAPQRERDSEAVAAFPLGFAPCSKPYFELVVFPLMIASEYKWQYIIRYYDSSYLHNVPDIESNYYDDQHATQVAAEDDWSSLCEERGYPRLTEEQIADRESPCRASGCNCRYVKPRHKTFIRALIEGDFDAPCKETQVT